MMPKIEMTVSKESAVNWKIPERKLLYIKTNGRTAQITIPDKRSIESGGDLKIEREERIDSIKTIDAKIESTNHPVRNWATVEFL